VAKSVCISNKVFPKIMMMIIKTILLVITSCNMRFEVLMAAKMLMLIFWVVTLCENIGSMFL
jgi:hypothetical protein